MFFPKCNADDYADSPVLAAWLTVTSDSRAIDMRSYLNADGLPVRCPLGKSTLETSPRCFSRDQLVAFATGLWIQGARQAASASLPSSGSFFAANDMDEVSGKWKVPDFLSPSVRNHLRLCKGERGSWLGYKFLELDIWFASRTEHEHNQLQMMCLVAGPEHVKKYKAQNPGWAAATKKYWNDTTPGAYNRGEAVLAMNIIKVLTNIN